MNAATILLYLFGNAAAIRKVASSRMAIPTGILLVFSAGVARNYDQVWFGESLKWLFYPLLFSTVSGLWLFLFVCRAWFGRTKEEAGTIDRIFWRRLGSFYGVFWMTAPIAWLYAIPVERWCNDVQAAQWNVRLLLVVSTWRVLLMSRVVSVIGGIPFLQAFAMVLLPAALEAGVADVYSFFSGHNLMAAMGGMRNSPAEEVLGSAWNTAIWGVLIAIIVSIAMRAVYGRPDIRPSPSLPPDQGVRRWRMPWIFLLLTAAFWTFVSIKPQREQRLNAEAARLAEDQDWRGLVAFLSEYRKEEFAPSIILPPNPWRWGIFEHLPAVCKHLTPSTPAWLQDVYLGYLEAFFSHDYLLWHSESPYNMIPMLTWALQHERGRKIVRHYAKQLRGAAGSWNQEVQDAIGEIITKAGG